MALRVLCSEVKLTRHANLANAEVSNAKVRVSPPLPRKFAPTLLTRERGARYWT